MNFLKKLIVALVLAPTLALAAEGGVRLDKAPGSTTDLSALQHGAKLFVNYCLNCHSASSMRYNRLQDIGLSDDQIRNNLLFSGDKVGDMMTVALTREDAKNWFGAAPPDLTVIARAKASSQGTGPDWLYTYLRTFYKDDTRPLGWNNMVFPDVAMPHALWELQGIRAAKYVEEKDPKNPERTIKKFAGFEQLTPGKLSPVEYDAAVGDLVAFMDWMGEPAQNKRRQLGVWVLLFMALFVILAWRLSASYWKEVK